MLEEGVGDHALTILKAPLDAEWSSRQMMMFPIPFA